MSFLHILKYSFQELWFFRRELGLIFWTLLFGLMALFIAIGFEGSSHRFTENRSRALMTADFLIYSTTPLPEDLKQSLDPRLQIIDSAKQIRVQGTLRAKQKSMLTEIRAVESGFPLLGDLKIFGMDAPTKIKALPSGSIWIDPLIKDYLEAEVGTELSLGQLRVKVAGVIEEDPSFARANADISPRIYLNYEDAINTGLIGEGSQVRYTEYYLSAAALPKELLEEVGQVLDEQALFLRTPEEQLRSLSRALDYFSRYLLLLSTITLVICFLVSAYLFEMFFRKRISSESLLKIFGSPRLFIPLKQILQILSCLFPPAILAIASCSLIFGLLQGQLAETLPEGFQLAFTLEDFYKSLILLLAMALSFYVLNQIRFRKISLILALQQSSPLQTELPSWKSILPLLGVSFVFLVLTLTFLDSFQLGLGVGVYFVLTCLFSFFVPVWFFRQVSRWTETKLDDWLPLKWALIQLSKHRMLLLLGALALSQIGVVANLLPHLKESFMRELQFSAKEKLPDLFAFNIPKETLPKLELFLKSSEAEIKHTSPLIQALWTKLNDESPKDEQFKSFPVRLTYRAQLQDSESILKGRELGPRYLESSGGIPEISVEENFADRNNIRIGDKMSFDVGGFEVKGEVVNLRKVLWQSFQPNFFIQFQPGVFEDFPQSFVSVIYFGQKQNELLAFSISEKFNELSLIDVKRTAGMIAELAAKLIGPIELITFLGLFGIWFILIGVTFHNLGQRDYEFSIYRVMGVSDRQVHRMVYWEYFLLSLLLILWSLFVGALCTGVATQWILEKPPHLDFSSALILSGLLISTLLLSAFIQLKKNGPRQNLGPKVLS